MSKRFYIKIVLLFFVTNLLSQTETGLRRIQISVGDAVISAEVAATPETRERGLMYRTLLRTNEGMLFVYPGSSRLAFWMKNTLIPLDLAFFDEDGYLITVVSMDPEPGVKVEKLRTYVSQKPAKYALEMNKGWFKKNEIRSHARLILPHAIPSY